MKITIYLPVVLFAAAVLSLAGCTAMSDGDSNASAAPTAKNVILFIGDGMGISTVTAARIYAGQKRGEPGEENLLSFEKFDHVALVKTYNTDAQVPDSAGTATAMHSGQKTRIGVLGIGPQAKRGDCAAALQHPLPLLGEEVKQRGLALGIVSTARLTHATPASVYARSANRGWEADASIPADQHGLGCIDIATQLIAADWDVALGGGLMAFTGSDQGGHRSEAAADLPAAWVARTGGTFVRDRRGLSAARLGQPVLGLFSSSHMTYMVDRPEDSGEPTLTEMTASALSRLRRDRDGFYLMVEGGRIDHAHHEGKAGYALEEAIEFARAIQYAVEHTDPDETLILVTADHSHVFTISGYPRRGNDILGLVVPVGREDDEAAKASDGKPYTTLAYTNGPGAIANMVERPLPKTSIRALQQAAIPLGSETHGGEDVALYATGPGAHRARGVIEQNLIYDIMRQAFGWD